MKTISNETKARYFARSEKLGVFDTRGYITGKDCDDIRYGYDTITKLLLRPISNLTNLEAIHIGKILRFKQIGISENMYNSVINAYSHECLSEGFRIFADTSMSYSDGAPFETQDSLKIHQYLQSIGIALPFYSNGETYSVSDLVEAGVIKFIE